MILVRMCKKNMVNGGRVSSISVQAREETQKESLPANRASLKGKSNCAGYGC